MTAWAALVAGPYEAHTVQCHKRGCPRQSEPMRLYCRHHLDMAARHMREGRERAKAAGVCTRCRKVPPEPGGWTCAECRRRHATHHNATAAVVKRLRRWQAGTCPKCGAPLATDGHEQCEACRKRQAGYGAKAYHARKAAGVCTRCGVSPPVEGGARCEACRAKTRKR